MSPLEEAQHLRALLRSPAFGQVDRQRLALDMRGQALRRLADLLPLNFNPDDAGQCLVLALQLGGATADDQTKATACLLRACTHAVESPNARALHTAVDCYALLDAPVVAFARPFLAGRKGGTVGAWREAIRCMLQANPKATNAEMWAAMLKRPPKGWNWLIYGKRFEGPGPGVPPTFQHSTFCVYAAQERKKLPQD